MIRKLLRLSYWKALTAVALVSTLQTDMAKATYVPVVISSGYNADVVANGTGAANTKTNTPFDNDAAEYTLMTLGYNNGTATSTSGLPASGLINSNVTSGLTYQLAHLDSNNSLQLNTTSTPGTLTFQTAQKAGEVYLLVSSGSGAGTISVTLNFASSATQTFTSISVPDWYNGSNYAILGLGRVSRTSNTISNDASNPRLYEVKLTVNPIYWSDSITSITVTRTSSSGRVNVMGVTINDLCSGHPTGGTTVMTPTIVCPNASFTVSTSGSTTSVGLQYQWESKPNASSTWTPIAGATNATYTESTGVSVSTDYRLLITCSLNSDTAYSSAYTVNPSSGLMGGTYTIDSAVATGGTNFQTFTDAVSAMQCGILGPVVFNVTPAIYNEQITLPSSIGSSASNTVTFNGNGATLTKNITAIGSNYATLRLNGADYITFKNLNIVAQGSTYGFAVHLSNGADWNTFDSCTITANKAATASTTGGVIMSGSPILATTTGANGSNNVFSNSTISGGYYAMQFYGNTVAGNQNNDVINCVVQDFYFYGIYYYQNTGALVSQNIVERPTRTTMSSFYGIYASTGCTDMTIERNRVRNQFGGNPTYAGTSYNIYVNSTAAAVGTENRVYNNLISNFNGNSSAYGIYLPSATNIQVYNNTVSIDNTAATAGTIYGLYSTGTTNVDVKNNILSVTQGGTGTKYCIYFSSNTGKTSNYNNLYMGSTGGTLNHIGYAGTAQTTFANWQAVNSNAYDQQGVSMDPMFASPATGNFAPTSGSLDNLGTPLAAITTDITGAARNATTPDIGAYEFSVAACSGTPTAGVAYGVPSAICPSVPLSLYDSAFTVASGISFQWMESPIGLNLWTPITNATSSSYTIAAGITTPTSYCLVVTCISSGLADTSNVISVTTINPAAQCYCTPNTSGGSTYYISAFTTTGGITNISNTSGSSTTGYTDFTGISPMMIAPGDSFNYSISAMTASSTFGYGMWIDYNANGTFEPSEQVVTTSSYTTPPKTGTITIPLTATNGLTRLRIIASFTPSNPSNPCVNSGSGEYEDYLIHIFTPMPCSGKPVAGTAFGPVAACPGTPFSINDTGFSNTSGITFQWEESPTGSGFWLPISNATNTNYTVTSGILSATSYRLIATCTNSGQADTTIAFSVNINPWYNCYCIPVSTCTNEGIQNVTFDSINNSTNKCANTSGYQDFGSLGSLTTVTQGQQVPISVTAWINSNPAGAGVWIDYDHNGVFDTTEFTLIGTTTSFSGTALAYTFNNTVTIDPNALTGITRMRVRSSNSTTATFISATTPCLTTNAYGEYEDYLITINAAVACTGTPSHVTASATGGANACPGQSFTLSATNASYGLGISYLWQYNDGSGWQTLLNNALNPVTTLSHTVQGISIATQYRFITTCSNSSIADTSNIVSKGLNNYLNCYCIPTGGGSTTYGINNVSTTNGLTNISNLNSGTTASGYTDYSGTQVLTTTINAIIGIAASGVGSSTYGWAIWVDWNKNGSFADAGEKMYNSTSYLNAIPANTTFTVPALDGNSNPVDTGLRKMRIIGHYLNSNPQNDICNTATTGYAEWEDYMVYIVPNTLAITLKDISAINMGAKNRVDWNTESEMQGDVFELQRSLDGKVFETIYVTPAKGAASRYSYVDNSPFQGVNYYRLNMKQSNGSNAYSKTVTATVTDKVFAMQAYPNPVSHVLTVAISGAQADDAMVQITDLTGKVLRSVAMHSATATIDMSGIASGVYLVKYVDANRTHTIRVTKQ